MNRLYYGDNLSILREHISDESVDLIYLDPPFNSNRNYNVLFKDESGKDSEAQITAFEDTWHWNQETERAYQELITSAAPAISGMIGALRQFVGTNQMMAYLVMMTARLIELHRVLKPTGSLYLHCDPTASHYLKIVLDAIFRPENFLNEVIWKRSHAHNSAKRFGPIHDVLLFYSKSDHYYWGDIRLPYEEEYEDRFFKFDDGDGRGRYWTGDLTGNGTRRGETGKTWRDFDPNTKGRHWMYPPSQLDILDQDKRIYWPSTPTAWPKLKRYLSEAKGIPLQDLIDDIYSLSTMGSDKDERLGFPTQKPIALLERLIEASSKPGDMVLDPFCGCGTAIAAAQILNRQWIGIDITHLAIALQKYRLEDAFSLVAGKDYEVVGEPMDLGSARQLAQDNRYQFQWWALSLIKARPVGGGEAKQGKKGSDKGIDGIISFIDDKDAKLKRIIVQVKSGHVKSGDIRDLKGTLDREGAALGVFITLEEPTRDMNTEAVSAGYYQSPGWGKDYPKIQILTVAEILAGAEVKMPPKTLTFKQAEKETADKSKQKGLF